MRTSGTLDHAKVVEAGRRVIGLEAAALEILRQSLGASFADAVQCILSTRGRLIVSGMGKSGHIARKIASTLASTGTPALYVHPAEASHGDLGMITFQDAVLLLSNSGETSELSDLIAYTRRFAIPLIGMASRPESTLVRQSDIGLILPTAPEACAVGMAPTTSTTMALALGDALAVALMEHREFSPEDFREFHPGGRLGAKLVTVANLMHTEDRLPLVDIRASMGEALITMSEKGFGVVGITEAANDLVGIITDGDLRRNLVGLMERRVEEVMTPTPSTISGGALATEALGRMNERKITALFVTPEEGSTKVIGILHVHDCLRAGVK